MSLPRPLPTAAGLDAAYNCPGSREVEETVPVETDVMREGRERHLVFEAWANAGCPPEWPAYALKRKDLAPVSKLPTVAKHEALPGVAEVAMWLDVVHEEAGILCVGRRPLPEEYPPGVHVYSGTTDAVGYLTYNGETLPGILEHKGRTPSKWQVHMASTAAWLLMGRPERMRSFEAFHPSGGVEVFEYDSARHMVNLVQLTLLAQELLAQRAGFPARYVAGEWCRYANCWCNCPIKSGSVAFRSKAEREAFKMENAP